MCTVSRPGPVETSGTRLCPLLLQELRRVRRPCPCPRSAKGPPQRPVRRSLYGPCGGPEARRLARDEISRRAVESGLRWNFDFGLERPGDGKYAWSRQTEERRPEPPEEPPAEPAAPPRPPAERPAMRTPPGQRLITDYLSPRKRPAAGDCESPGKAGRPRGTPPSGAPPSGTPTPAPDDRRASRSPESSRIAELFVLRRSRDV